MLSSIPEDTSAIKITITINENVSCFVLIYVDSDCGYILSPTYIGMYFLLSWRVK